MLNWTRRVAFYSRLLSQNFFGMKNLDTAIPLKIAGIECEDLADVVNLHCGDKPRIVSRLSEYLVG